MIILDENYVTKEATKKIAKVRKEEKNKIQVNIEEVNIVKWYKSNKIDCYLLKNKES